MINSVLLQKKEVNKNNKQITVSDKTVNNILKEHYGRPKKIRKVFYLFKEQMKKRYKFCENILNKKLNSEEIMFTDETKINMSTYTNYYKRIVPEDQRKLKNGEKTVYKLLNRQEKKFEPSIIIEGGISYYGIIWLILLDGTMNDFSYVQALLFYKEDIDKLLTNYGVNILLEQDGATWHSTKASWYLLNKLIKEEGWFHQNSPDLAFP